MELEQRGKKWFWNPVYGREYCVGYHHSKGLFNSELVHAFYFGSLPEGRVFFNERNGKVMMYMASPIEPAAWYGDAGDDEPAFPMVNASFIGEITGKESTYVKEVLARLKK